MAVVWMALALNGEAAPAASAASVSKTAASEAQAPAGTAISPAAAPVINATAIWVQDLQSGQVLTQKRGDDRIEPAGLVKLMSAYVVFDALKHGTLKADAAVTVATGALSASGSRMFLQAGQKVKVSELITGMAALCADDATLTLAQAVSGSEAEFVKKMNATAAAMGLENTHFVNATGQSVDAQYSSVHDLAKLASALQQDFPEYTAEFSRQYLDFNGITQVNRNRLLFRDSQADGLMTAYAPSAGYHIAATSHVNGRHLLVVLVGSDNADARSVDTGQLLNWAAQNFQTIKLYAGRTKIMDLPVFLGAARRVGAGFGNEVYVTLPQGSRAQGFAAKVNAVSPVTAPVAVGQSLGSVTLTQNGQVLKEIPLTALNAVPEAGYWRRLWGKWTLWWQKRLS